MNLIAILIFSLLTISSVIGGRVGRIPKRGQKSLVIIFDGIQSKQHDLDQLRNGARKILNESTKLDVKTIFNYILVVFNASGNDVKISHDPEDLLKILDEIEIREGGNFSDMPLRALKIGIQNGLPKSIVYVITDSTAKDHNMFIQTLEIMKRKETVVNFFLTEDCGDRNETGYLVYTKLARYSNGQVFNNESDGIEKVLMALRTTMKDSNTQNHNGRTFSPGATLMPILVDSTMMDIEIRLSGEGVNMTINNPLNQIVTGDVLTLENWQIVSFKNPMPGRWTIDADSSSEYTVQIGSNSELKFEYGFFKRSTTPKNHGETSVNPLKGSNKILTFFISDPAKIGFLSKATLVLNKADEAGSSKIEI